MSNNASLTQKPEWKALKDHFQVHKHIHIQTLFKNDLGREKSFTLNHNNLSFDYSRNRVTEETVNLLCALAKGCDLESMREKMFSGFPLNNTENRPVLHVAMRGSEYESVHVPEGSPSDLVDKLHHKMEQYCDHIHNSKSITDIVNIGIGGSDTGPRLICDALQHLSGKGKKMHFISNVDPAPLLKLFETLDPKSTLFLVASKTFTTMETMTNAISAKEWMIKALGEEKWSKHFCALTGNQAAAEDFGIEGKYIFPLPDWVGGRFSIWSSVGLPIALAVGFDRFKEFLQGAQDADKHFLTQPFHSNIPVMMALLGIWYRNFWDFRAHCVLPYSSALQMLPQYIQQLDMESNGKSVDRHGNKIDYQTAPAVFGGVGTDTQHTFFQYLHQGTDITPCDFVALRNPVQPLRDHHAKLNANVIGQAKALMEGRRNEKESHRNFDGNRPSNIFWMETLLPYNLGQLLAFYEHKIFVQGVIWDINSFDQWGVQLGKELAEDALKKFN